MNLADILDMVADSPKVSVADGEAIVTDGEESPPLCVLVSGELEVQRRGNAIIRIGEPGAIVGELGMLLEQPASADVVAVGDVVIHRIADGEQLLRDHPEFMGFLARMLARRLWQVSTYLSDIQEQFAGSSTTMGLVPTVLRELLDSSTSDFDVGSEREPDSPY